MTFREILETIAIAAIITLPFTLYFWNMTP